MSNSNRNYSSIVTERTLAATMTASQTTMRLNVATGVPAFPFTMVIAPDTTSEEIVTVTGVSSGPDSFNIVRGQDGTTGIEHGLTTDSSNTVVRHMITGRDLQEAQDHIAATSNVHGVTGAIASSASPTFTGTVTIPSTTSIAAVSGTVTSTSLGYVSGATSNLQTQISNKANYNSANTFTTGQTINTGGDSNNGLKIKNTNYTQSANTLSVLNTANTEITRVRPGGQLGVGTLITGTALGLNTDIIGDYPAMIIKAGQDSPTSNSIELRPKSSNTPVMKVDYSGNITTNGKVTASTFTVNNVDVPLAFSSGINTATVASGGTTANTGTITFPTSRFTVAPVVTATCDNSLFTAAVTSLSSTTCVITVRKSDGTNVSSSTAVNVYWTAIQQNGTAYVAGTPK